MFKKNSKEYITYLTAIIGATMVAKKMGSKSENEDSNFLKTQSIYNRGSGRSPVSGIDANDLLIERLGHKYGRDATWESTEEQRREVLAPFIPKLDPKKFYATMSRPMHSFRNMSVISKERSSFKPRFVSKYDPQITNGGFWIAEGYSWIDWMSSEAKNWLYSQNYIYEVTPNFSEILKLSTHQDLIYFTQAYRGRDESHIRWQEIVDQYAGIVIAPYIRSARMTIDWYYPWDVSSGCIWNWDGIKEIKLISQREGSPAASEIVHFGGDF